ncbi:MAG: hypothetical protein NTV84_04520 [Methanoregula sp.]|nr:hypothetical protein [Methanoregula sp.]
MDAPPFENLRRFFERIKNVGFFERIFSWKTVVSLGYDAFGEYQHLQNLMQEKDAEISGLVSKNRDLSQSLEYRDQQATRLQQDLLSEQHRSQSLNEKITEKERDRATLAEAQANSEDYILRLKSDLVTLAAKNEDLQVKINERENMAGGLVAADRKNQQAITQLKEDLSASQGKFDQLNSQFIEAQKTLAEIRQKEEERIREHDARITELTTLKKQLEEDRLRVQAERDEKIRSEFAEMEQTWKKHEELVEQSLRSICQRHTIEYCDKEKFPVSGKKPDNAVIIADQYVIFDAKSPKNSDELGNFPSYIKNQAEAAKKYAKEENVKKDIFLVVPANTLGYLDDFHLDMADYQVYVVTHECLEPVVLALRKIEDYQFIDQLSPEDRENICHVIGKFAHATKRRMQIDTYFFNEFLGLLKSCESLPDEILKKVVDYEKAEKMNPPMEKRKKLIPIKELEHDIKVITKEAEAREIDVTAVTKEKIDTITLTRYLE